MANRAFPDTPSVVTPGASTVPSLRIGLKAHAVQCRCGAFSSRRRRMEPLFLRFRLCLSYNVPYGSVL